jgi:hypothetical protein
MRELGLSPTDLRILEDDELLDIPEGDPIPSTVPGPPLDDVTYVESEGGVYVVREGRLRPMTRDAARLVPAQRDFDKNAFKTTVAYLPMSVLRGLIYNEEAEA